MIYRFRHKIIGPVVILWLLLTMASVVGRKIVWDHLALDTDASVAADQFREALDQYFSALQTAETRERGFLLTGDDADLKPFKQAASSSTTAFEFLALIAMKYPALETNVLDMKGLTDVRLSEMDEEIHLRQEKDVTPAAAFSHTARGDETMDHIRNLVAHLRENSLAAFAVAQADIRRHLRTGQSLSLIAGILGIGTGLAGLYLVRVSYLQERAQKELMVEKAHAETIAVQKSAFLANMSHEIRTPMNAILGFGELLQTEPLTSKQSQHVRAICRSGKSLLQLINDILDLSKLEAGKLELQLEPTDLWEILGFLQTVFAQEAAAKSVQLKFGLTAVPNVLLLDRLRLRQVLVNLVGNAVKFTERGQVSVRVVWETQAGDANHGTLLIDVEDTGVGISPGKREEIFKPFVQADPHRAAEQRGTGLGLNIVQRLTELMGGVVTLDSTVGKGSIFHLRFPGVAVSGRLPVSDLTEPDAIIDFNDFAPATLLVADDNEANRDLFSETFQGTHHQVRLACNGQEALQFVRQTRPAIALLDIRMPVMDGREALVEIRKLPGCELLPVLAVTASSQANDELDLRNRFSGYLRKPFSRQELYRELAQFLPRQPWRNQADLPPPLPLPLALPEPAGDWRALAIDLNTLLQGEWVALRESLAINETGVFAQKLRSLGQLSHCPPLRNYADLLSAHAEAYAVRDLELHLAEFPALVRTIEKESVKKV